MSGQATTQGETRPWFSAEQQGALRDFWAVYEPLYDELSAKTEVIAYAHPEFGPLLRTIPKEHMEANAKASRALLERALDGEWAAYENNLRIQGATFCEANISFGGWYDLTRTFVRDLVPYIVKAYADDPPRLAGALIAMHQYLDRVMSHLAEAYLGAKESALRQRERDLATTLDSIGDAVISTDAAGNITRINPTAQSLTGWTHAEALGRPLTEVFCVEDQDKGQPIESPVARVLRDGLVVGLANHSVLVTRDGRRVEIADSAAPIRSDDDAVRGVVLVFRDTTAQRAAEEALRNSEARYRQIVETTAEGVWVYDANLITSFVNHPMARMLGYSPDEMLGRSCLDFFVSDARQDLATPIKAGERVEHQLKRKNGSTLWAAIATSRSDTKGQPAATVALVADITEQRRMEEIQRRSGALEEEARRAQEANRLKSEFLANMSHELRTPLNGIIGFSELMHDGKVGPVSADHKEYLGDILTSARHLLQLINDVLDLAKVESGKMEFRPDHIDLAKLIHEVRDVLRTMTAKKRITLSTEVNPALSAVFLDPAKLKQVLYNYLSNALKFTPDEGHVTVRVLPEGPNHLRIEVEDTGIGIRPEDMHRLFVEFQQIDASAAKKYQGTGLGLALTRRIVEAQGGRVEVRSTHQQGSVFSAILPRVATEAAGPLPKVPVAALRVGAPTVLVIEDDSQDQAWLVKTLNSAGYNVETAATGTEAIAHIERRTFDAVTLDLLLPDMSGWEVLRKMRASPLNKDIPVIVVTVISEKGAGAGFAIHDFLSKPVKTTDLIEALKRAGVPPYDGAVLIIDDDVQSLKMLETALQAHGYRVICKTSGESGLNLAAQEAPAAVVLDLLMPEMDGFEFLSRFRRTPSGRRTPVIVWTAKDLTAQERARLQSAAQAIVLKGEGSSASLLAEVAAYVTQDEGVGHGP